VRADLGATAVPAGRYHELRHDDHVLQAALGATNVYPRVVLADSSTQSRKAHALCCLRISSCRSPLEVSFLYGPLKSRLVGFDFAQQVGGEAKALPLTFGAVGFDT
jgi:hypothetical protein